MNLRVGVSNRHIHLTTEDYQILCGKIPLEVRNNLVQPGEFASNITLALKTPKSIIENVRLLGPLRKYTQVEISKTDAYKLGLNPPIRTSGELENAEEITIVGPNGEVTKKCCIIANRHIHINKEERIKYGLVNVDKVKVKINTEKGSVLENVFIKENDNFVLEFHIDTDDANATLTKTGDIAEIIK